MREGPLAALFRKTEEEGGTDAEAVGRETPPHDEPRREDPPAPEPAAPAASEPVAEEAPPVVREPRERLRHVFSSEIPENILDRESAPVRTPEPPPAPPPVVREEAGLYGAPRPVGSPVLRV
ncbi:MAG TPA: cell division protein FtsZ, partial [Solirubrobacteraceae bacterium]|nr:cell division protein FtsZ [Solirubrobacteraceae bacterium]